MLIFRNTPEIFGRLQDAGMVPIITHPERNELLQQKIEDIAQWVDAGALVQVTGQSLLGHFGKKAAEFARTLLDHFPAPGLPLLVGGGIAYSVGVLFYRQRRLRYGHAIWHIFSVAGTALHFGAVATLL